MARVSAPVTGRALELHANEGQAVKRGQSLAPIYSADLSSAQSAFLKALTQRQAAERAVFRAKALLDAGVIGEAELQRSMLDEYYKDEGRNDAWTIEIPKGGFMPRFTAMEPPEK